MSDDEEVYSEEESEEPAAEQEDAPAPAPSGPTEAELAMQRRKAKTQVSSEGLDEAAKELLEANAQERDMMAREIEELRARSEQRKKERQREEQEIAARRAEEDVRRKQEEEDRKRQKEEQEKERKAKRDAQMQEFAKMQNTKANFVIIKKSLPLSNELVGGGGDEEKEDGDSNKMSREQMEQERKAILAQRIQPLEVDGADEAKLKSKAESLHKEILRLEGEKYDLEKRFREQQTDMLEMAERARNINKVGKTGLKRVVLKEDERDTIQEKFSGAPSKIELYSRFERQPDKRAYKEKFTVFSGPTYLFPAEKNQPYSNDQMG